MNLAPARAREIVVFWFVESGPAQWFGGNPQFDAKIRARFLHDCEAVARGERDAWLQNAEGCLALCLLLDQFPRNLFRGTPRAFATDARAREITGHVLKKGFDRAGDITPAMRDFFYLPLQHSENLEDQERCVRYAREQSENPDFLAYAQQHRDVIARFGRFPHRNAILERETTAEEAEFLKTSDSHKW